MKRLRLFAGNRLEALVAALADVMRRPLADPLAQEIVVVQSLGMERWIAMALARRHGICANLAFPFPNDAVYARLFRAILPDLPEDSPFERPVMAWRIMGLLPGCLDTPEFGPLQHYAEGGDTDIKLFQLSERIADLFDQYLTFRPDWIHGWEAGGGAGWQPVLWRKLAEGRQSEHRAALARSFTSLIDGGPLISEVLPERISVFGISSLPRFHMEILDALSRYREVNLFLMNPCADFWGDTLSKGELRRVTRTARRKEVPEADLHIGPQNSLLASLGVLGRDFFDMVTEFDPEVTEIFEDPGGSSLLKGVQSDILNRVERPAGGAPRLPVAPTDRSIAVHVCHSPMRETEVLLDQLLADFEADETLRPGDILVMAPDIETYAPYIQAVFDRPPGDPKRIPFSIADRSVRSESRLAEAFMALLDMDDGRMGAARVTALLEIPWIHRRFELDETDVGRIRTWIRDVRIRWGVDGKARAALGLPGIEQHTWRAGLDRLLLGYAMAGHGEQTFGGILPYDAMEGSATAALGGLLEFTHRLFSLAERLRRPKTPAAWAEFLSSAIDAFFAIDAAAEPEALLLGEAIASLADTAGRGGFDRPVDRRVIRSFLAEKLDRNAFGFGFITGGVTFCAMLPMRSIPFRTIALLGMNSADYPRNAPALGFDLMAAHPRPGDRSRRKDDRYLFLETLLSAREKLYISYVGQSIRDNSAIPPSVLVSELMDTLVRGYDLAGGGALEDHIVTRHRLQGFSPAYFDGEDHRLFSYSDENLRAARRLASKRSERTLFIAEGLPEPEALWRTVDLAGLCRFFMHPHRYLLNLRLGIYLGDADDAIPETEPFTVAGLDRFRLAEDLVRCRIAGHPKEAVFTLKQLSGELPHGRVGEADFEKLSGETAAFYEKISAFIGPDAADPVEFRLPVESFTLTGRIADLHGDRRVQYRCAAVKAGDLMGAWIHHLALNASDGPHPRRTAVAGTDAVWEFPPLPDAAAELAPLLALYWEGLMRPIPFFPRSSLAFAEQRLTRKKSVEDALKAARKAWNGYNGSGEGDNPYYQRCVGSADPFGEGFQETAIATLAPMLRCRRKIA